MSVSQLDHSARLRLSGLRLALTLGLELVCLSTVPRQDTAAYPRVPMAKWICGIRDGDVRRQSIAYFDDDASWSLDEYLKLPMPFATGES